MDIIGEHVRLRASRDDDAHFFATTLADPEVVRYLGAWAWVPYGEREAREFITSGAQQLGVNWTIESIADGQPLGATGLHEIDHRNRNCSWGIWIGPPQRWDQGLGTEACRLAVGYAFRTLGMEKVMLKVYEGNARGRRAYEKAGFSSEGVLRRHMWAQGRLVDVELMAVFSDNPLYREPQP